MGIYFDGMLYHASRKRGVAKQKLGEYLNDASIQTVWAQAFRMRRTDSKCFCTHIAYAYSHSKKRKNL